ncbi:MAG: zinc transporter [Rhodobacteraceae bacterium]|nr:zinc transporter [Paracoccaceae bacterium]
MQRILALLLCVAGPLAADPPRIVADIAPVHSLVAMVTEGVTEPELLIPANASAHDLALKPSQARALTRADLVVWVGPELSPGLGRALDATAERTLALLRVPGTQLYPARDAALFGDMGLSGHVEDAHAGHDHSHDGIDPHAWLDPVNAVMWLTALAETLAELDPEHAAAYRDNAVRAVARLSVMTARMDDQLEPARHSGLIAFHDAFQYFEARFGLSMVGAITPSDGSDPGPARLSALRDAARDGAVVCAFAEPQFNAGLLEAVTQEAGLPVATLDPMGANLTVGSDLYEALLMQMSGAVTDCISMGVSQAGSGE